MSLADKEQLTIYNKYPIKCYKEKDVREAVKELKEMKCVGSFPDEALTYKELFICNSVKDKERELSRWRLPKDCVIRTDWVCDECEIINSVFGFKDDKEKK